MEKSYEIIYNSFKSDSLPCKFGVDFDKVMNEYSLDKVTFITNEYIDFVQKEYNVFSERLDFVRRSAKAIRNQEIAARYAFLLEIMLKAKPNGSRIKVDNIKPTGDNELDNALEMAPLFAELAILPHTLKKLSERGLPSDIEETIKKSVVKTFEGTINGSSTRLGREGFLSGTYFSWNQIHLETKLIPLGVYNFEMRFGFADPVVVLRNKQGETKILAKGIDVSKEGYPTGTAGQEDVDFHADFTETETHFEGYLIDTENCVITKEKVQLSKDEWYIALRPTDHTIAVHIPKNADISPEKSIESYRKALEITTKYFPEFKPKAFTCGSWMIDPQLRNMLKPESRILSFQNKYFKYPRINDGTGVFSFVFNKASVSKEEIKDLQEDTSLHRAIKKHYLDGKYIYAQGGIFFFDNI